MIFGLAHFQKPGRNIELFIVMPLQFMITGP